MKVYLDNIIYSLQKAGGISVYWSELTKRISDFVEVVYISHSSDSNNLFFQERSKHDDFKEVSLPLFIKRFLPLLKRLPAGSVYHSSYHRVSWQKDVVNITTVHDCGHELGLMQKGIKRRVHLYFKKSVLKHSDGVICVSENTRQDLLKFYPFINPETVKVIYNGVSVEYQKKTFENRENDLPTDYILFVGGRYPYKNFKTLVKLLSLFDSWQLVIVGGPLTRKEEVFLNRTLPGHHQLVNAASNSKLHTLYSRAFCLVYPSLYEGFGLPVLEAMAAGCPVIAMNASSMPEVAGNACLLLDKLDYDEFYSALNYLEDPVNRTDLVNKGFIQASKFSWDKCAEETAAFYRYIMSQINVSRIKSFV